MAVDSAMTGGSRPARLLAAMTVWSGPGRDTTVLQPRGLSKMLTEPRCNLATQLFGAAE
jgi:hypothetical protein